MITRSLLIATVAAALVQAQPQPAAELKYAVIVTRHGVRAPTWESARLNRYSSSPWPDFGVGPGILTAHGRELMKLMGGYYRDWFAQQGLLGKAACGDATRTYFWADTDQRTLETAKALSEAMLPGCTAQIHSVTGGKADPLFDPLEAGLVKQDPQLGLASVIGRIGPKLDAVVDANRPAFDALVRILNGNGKAAASIFDEPTALKPAADGVSMSGPLALSSTLTENLLLEYTNGMSGDKLGWGRLNEANLHQIMSLHTTYADLMRRTPYIARVRGSNLLSHVLNSLRQAMDGKAVKSALGGPQDAIVVISGHDTNISNLSGMLDLSWTLPSHQKDDAPPGGALVFSLWRDKGSGKYSVRLQMVAQTLEQMHDAKPLSLAAPPVTANLFISGCGTSAEGYACDWASFLRVATAAIGAEFVEKQ